MLDMSEIHEEIKKLEDCDCTNYDVCKKLAILYIVKNYYPQKETTMPAAKIAMSPVSSSPMMTP